MADVAVEDLRKEADRAEAHLRKEEGFWVESIERNFSLRVGVVCTYRRHASEIHISVVPTPIVARIDIF